MDRAGGGGLLFLFLFFFFFSSDPAIGHEEKEKLISGLHGGA
jgi:hypothetical protein